MSDIDKYREGLVCLVPKKEAVAANSMYLSSHEKTLCDCQVLEIFSTYDALLVEAKKLREAFDELFTSAYLIGGEHQLRISKIDYNYANDALASFDKYIEGVK